MVSCFDCSYYIRYNNILGAVVMFESTIEAHMLNHSKYVRRLRKFNKNNIIKGMSNKMYDNSRLCIYQIEVNNMGLTDIKQAYKGKRWWPNKEIMKMIEFIRNAYPKDWFKKRSNKKYMDRNKVIEEKPKIQFDIDFNII